MLRKLRKYIRQVPSVLAMPSNVRAMQTELLLMREAIGRLEARQTALQTTPRLADYEFRVFSQWGQDGIIQYLIRNLPIEQKTFIEFGVQSYQEANTRFLVMHDNWRGLIIDGSQEFMDAVKGDDLYWKHTLTAVCSFVTPSNVNSLFQNNGFSGPIGLLSIDIDGMDYWVWKNISVVSPAIVVVEYNARFGPDRCVTVPLDEKFIREAAHHSNIYFGASLGALVKLAEEKGYACVGCNSNGNDSFYVRRDLLPSNWKSLTSREAFVPCRYRESRNEQGRLSFLNEAEEQAILAKLPMTEV